MIKVLSILFIFTILFFAVILPSLCLEDTAANPITLKRIVELYSNDQTTHASAVQADALYNQLLSSDQLYKANNLLTSIIKETKQCFIRKI